MKKFLFILNCMAILGCMCSVFGCEEKEPEVAFEFSVTAPDGKDLSAVRQFTYGEKADYTFTAKALKEVGVVAPQGWTATASVGSKTISVTAPSAKDATAATSGDITVTASANDGQTKEVKLKVEVVDAAIVFTVKDLGESVEFTYGSTAEFAVESSNVETVEVAAPNAWTVDASATKVKVTAPDKTAPNLEKTGTITLTPKSAKGNAGTAVSFAVSIDEQAPALAFDSASAQRVYFGSKTELVATTAENLASVEVMSYPKGWTVTFALADNKLTIKAPAYEDDDIDGDGSIFLVATSDSGTTLEVSVPVCLVGINNADDFMAFSQAVASANEDDQVPFLYKGAIILNADIDLSEQPNNVLVPGTFSGVFDGRGHTVNLDITTDQAQAGLFEIVEYAVIKNLKTTGAILHTGQSVKVTMSAIALFAKQAEFENVSNYASLTQTGTNEDSWGYVAGLVCDQQENATYTNCHNYGPITCVSPKYFGGLVASIWDNTEGTMTDCSNEGPIKFNFSNLNTNSMLAGGVFGTNAGSNWRFIRCYNSGSITYDLDQYGIRALGGFAGMGVGYFENCYNSGSITNTLCMQSGAPSDNRRIGGFVGAAWEDKGFTHHSKGCYNTGNITDVGQYIGGFIAMSDNYAHFENDYNTGNIISISTAYVPTRVGGFGGGIWNDALIEGCYNKGRVICTTSRVAAAFAVVGDEVTLKNCSNEGEIKCGATTLALGKAWSPLIAGLCAIAGDKATVTIENCKNTGAVTGMGQAEQLVQSLYASEGVAHKLADPTWEGSDLTSCDQASKDASAGASVTYIPKDQWSDAVILSWLQ